MAVSRKNMLRFWRVVNPVTRGAAGVAPWWVVLETTGRKSGLPRRFPLARGPVDGNVYWLVAVHGRRADFVRNVEANGAVRLRHRGRWRSAHATVEPMTPEMLRRFNAYGRFAERVSGIDPVLLRVVTD